MIKILCCNVSFLLGLLLFASNGIAANFLVTSDQHMASINVTNAVTFGEFSWNPSMKVDAYDHASKCWSCTLNPTSSAGNTCTLVAGPGKGCSHITALNITALPVTVGSQSIYVYKGSDSVYIPDLSGIYSNFDVHIVQATEPVFNKGVVVTSGTIKVTTSGPYCQRNISLH